jgi:hypothetical protein
MNANPFYPNPLDGDIDTLRDLYMNTAQREAYDRIVALARSTQSASDISKAINHDEAAELAEAKAGVSNLARCYLELRGMTAACGPGAGVALREIKLRLHFMGTPGEPMWNTGTEEKPFWIPDWRYEIGLLEHALHGSPIEHTERPRDTKRRCEVKPPEVMPDCRAFVAAFAASLDADFGFWSSPTAMAVRQKLYSPWAKANAEIVFNPAPKKET